MDARAKRQALRTFSNGIYVLTARDARRIGAATVTWVSQASFRPPLVMAALRRESNVYQCLASSGRAAVHVVAEGQQDIARRFFAPTDAAGATINGEPFAAGDATAAPLLTNLQACVECTLERIVDTAGDHAIVILRVVEATYREPFRPLTIAASPWEYGG